MKVIALIATAYVAPEGNPEPRRFPLGKAYNHLAALPPSKSKFGQGRVPNARQAV